MSSAKQNETWQICENENILFRELKLLNKKNGEFITILPELGARLNSVNLLLGNELTPVIRTQGEFVIESNDSLFNNAKLFPFAGRISRGIYEHSGISYQLPVNYKDENNACHGFAYNKSFSVSTSRFCKDFAEIELQHDFKETESGYPFKYRISVIYKLSINSEITVTTRIFNFNPESMFFSDGWHPYFQLPSEVDTLKLQFNAKEKIELNSFSIPTGKRIVFNNGYYQKYDLKNRAFDDVFMFANEKRENLVELISEEKNYSFRIWFESGKDKYNYLVVYTPPDRKSIAIEPMTSNVNAFNNKEGLVSLDPGKEWSASYGFNFKV